MMIENFLIRPANSIYDALSMIDKNKKGFLLVVDEQGFFIGSITDGDIRRAILNGIDIHSNIELAYNKNSTVIEADTDFRQIIKIFRNSRIKFIPIVNRQGLLVNVITKPNMHTLLLGEELFDLDYDFSSIDDSIIEQEIHDRPWGFYKTTFINKNSQSKVINIYPEGVISLQEHKKREEYWIVINGVGEVTIGDSMKKVESGSFVYIPKGCKHRLKNLSSSNSLMIAEVQLGDYFGEDDIVRYADEYGRK